MSLRVWLPLNGNLRNQGISDLIFSAASSNTTTNTNGKIGTCYINNSHSAGGLISDKPILLGPQYSMCCWFKFTDLEASSSLGGGLISQHRYSKNTGFGLTIKYVSSTTGYLSVNTGTGSARTYNTYCGTTLLQANTWYHACGTYDGTNIKIYVNGVLEKTQTYNMSAPEDYLTIFCWSLSGSSGATIHNDYKLNGALNDVRIYDHCLSAAEVKEIAQGLVLHYKLDGGLFGNPNLYTGSEKFTGSWGGATAWTTSSDTFQNFVVKEKSSVWGGLYQNISCAQNDIFTISFWGRVDSGGTIRSIHRSNLGNTTTGLTILAGNFQVMGDFWVRASDDGTQWKRYWATVKITSSDITYLQWRLENSTADKKFQICGIKLEKGDAATPWCPADSELDINRTIAEDNSGYGHDGTIVGSPISHSDSARYSTCTYIGSGSQQYINAPNLAFENMKQGTINIWINRLSTDSTWRLYTYFANGYNWTGNSSDFIIIGSTGGQAIVLDCCSNTYSFTPNLNQWYMYTISWNLETHQAWMYVNGELKSTKNSANIDTTYASKHNGHYFGNGYSGHVGDYLLSDARIYCTQLLDTDIKQLYNVGMKVDKGQNIHVFEFNEQKEKNSLSKQGQLFSKEFEENTKASLYKTNIIEANEFIER